MRLLTVREQGRQRGWAQPACPNEILMQENVSTATYYVSEGDIFIIPIFQMMMLLQRLRHLTSK